MVAVWMVCNAILAMAVSEAYPIGQDIKDNFYLKFILWSVAAVALFRTLGSCAFGLINIISAIVEGRVQAKLERLFGGGDEGSGGRSRSFGEKSRGNSPRVSGIGFGGSAGESGGYGESTINGASVMGGSSGNGSGGRGGSSGISSGLSDMKSKIGEKFRFLGRG